MVEENPKPLATLIRRSDTAQTESAAKGASESDTNTDTLDDGEQTGESALSLKKLPVRERPQCIKLLGEGGMGTVYVAHDPFLRRDIAVKLLHKDFRPRSSASRRLLLEAQITASLRHPNIVPVHAIAQTEHGRPFFTMQMVEGYNLRQWWKREQLAPGTSRRINEGLKILTRVCEALEYAHSRGVLHLDIKPDNIMVGPFGQVYLMDWGLALSQEFPRSRRSRSEIAGTPAYMSPEQARGEPMDERADVFGLGALLFELISGKTPYGSLKSSSISRSARGGVSSLAAATIDFDVPDSLLSLVNRMISAEPDKRFENISEVGAALNTFLQDGLYLPQYRFESGDIIVRQGDAGQCAFMILSGRCEAFLERADGSSEFLRVMEAGDIFGEIALLLEGRRTATVRTLETTEVMQVDLSILEKSGITRGWTAKLLKQLAHRLSSKS